MYLQASSIAESDREGSLPALLGDELLIVRGGKQRVQLSRIFQ